MLAAGGCRGGVVGYAEIVAAGEGWRICALSFAQPGCGVGVVPARGAKQILCDGVHAAARYRDFCDEGWHGHGIVRARATDFRCGGTTRSASGPCGVTSEILERDARRDETGSRDDHLLALGVDETGAPGLDRPHMGTAGGRRCGGIRERRASPLNALFRRSVRDNT